MSEQQAAELLVLLRQIATDLAALKAQGEASVEHTHAIKSVLSEWGANGLPSVRVTE